jgi:LysM repeat protein
MGLAKATITIEHTGQSIPVMFNPEEYSLSQDNNFASQNIPGLSGPILQFVHGNLRTLDMELFFDTTDARVDVRNETGKITKLLAIDSELHAPPVLKVAWASLQFRCVLARAGQQFTRFLEDGRPVRARLKVTFNEFLDPAREARQVNRQTADFTKVHIVTQGETLSDLANKYYRNAQLWRPIALRNDIEDPQVDFTGVTLQIPSLPFVVQETGEVLA